MKVLFTESFYLYVCKLNIWLCFDGRNDHFPPFFIRFPYYHRFVHTLEFIDDCFDLLC